MRVLSRRRRHRRTEPAPETRGWRIGPIRVLGALLLPRVVPDPLPTGGRPPTVVPFVEVSGRGLVPTWSPSPRTRLFGPQIDHVLMTSGIAAESFEVRDIPGSDHRAIVSRLRLPG